MMGGGAPRHLEVIERASHQQAHTSIAREYGNLLLNFKFPGNRRTPSATLPVEARILDAVIDVWRPAGFIVFRTMNQWIYG
jgi:hypothetical protein